MLGHEPGGLALRVRLVAMEAGGCSKSKERI